MEKQQKQELGWRATVLPIPAFHVILHIPSTCSGMQEWIPSIPILVSVVFPSLHLKFLLLVTIAVSLASTCLLQKYTLPPPPSPQYTGVTTYLTTRTLLFGRILYTQAVCTCSRHTAVHVHT